MMYQVLLYGCVGITSALVDFSIFFISLPLVYHNYVIAAAIAFSFAVTVNFILCSWYIFTRHNISLLHAYIRHVGPNICSFFLSLGLLSMCMQTHLFSNFFIPKIITAGILMLFNYTSARFFSFNNVWQK